MITAKTAREKSLKAQKSLVKAFIQNALDAGLKSICITDELEESMYDEIIQELLNNGFDIISKKYTDGVNEIISWENGKKSNGSKISLDCRLMDLNDNTTLFLYHADEFDEADDSNH